MFQITKTLIFFMSVWPMFAYAAGPFNANAQSAGPQGFELSTLTSIKDIKAHSVDDQLVYVRGRFTEWLKGDKYWFIDEAGEGIEAELDADYDWSHIHKDQWVEIFAEVDKDWFNVELEVIRAKPLN